MVQNKKNIDNLELWNIAKDLSSLISRMLLNQSNDPQFNYINNQ